jgi:hypothetical protein
VLCNRKDHAPAGGDGGRETGWRGAPCTDSELGAATESPLESKVEVPRTVTALRRQATEDAKAISNAESAAWSASGVFEVIDQVTGLTVIL